MLSALFAGSHAAAEAAEALPLWVTHPPAANDRYQYYVGHSTGAATSAEGVFNASLDALAKLSAADFGGPVPVPGQATPLPANVRFGGVEQIQLLKIRRADDGTFEIYVLYRYPLDALDTEQKREKLENGNSKPAAARGRLKLQIDRSDALVIVNGYPLAASTKDEPLELEVPAGQYVDAEFTQYETIRAIRKYFIAPGKAEIREVTLIERPGFVTASANPVDAIMEAEDGTSLNLPSTDRLRLSPGTHQLTFRKAGYESKTVKVVVVRDRTSVVPKVVLLSAEEKRRRLADPPWLLEIAPLGNHAGTLNSPRVGAYTYGASLDRRLVGRVRLRLAYFRGSGSNTEANPNDVFGDPITTDTISSSYVEIGLPVEAYSLNALQRFYLEPMWVMATQQVGGLNANGQVKQQGFGGAICFRQFFEPGDDAVVVAGFGARAALTDYYSSTGGFGGKLALSISFIELLIGI